MPVKVFAENIADSVCKKTAAGRRAQCHSSRYAQNHRSVLNAAAACSGCRLLRGGEGLSVYLYVRGVSLHSGEMLRCPRRMGDLVFDSFGNLLRVFDDFVHVGRYVPDSVGQDFHFLHYVLAALEHPSVMKMQKKRWHSGLIFTTTSVFTAHFFI